MPSVAAGQLAYYLNYIFVPLSTTLPIVMEHVDDC